MRFVLVSPGTFTMGGPKRTEYDISHDKQPHTVNITRPFYCAIHETTVKQFRAFVEETGYETDAEKTGKGGLGWDAATSRVRITKTNYTWRNPGFEQGDTHPVVNVTWNDAQAFVQWLSRKSLRKCRLPTEAEWEYACRAGTGNERALSFLGEARYEELLNVSDRSLHKISSPDSFWTGIDGNDGYPFTSPVGAFPANAWGIHDMHGNAAEWCEDWYDKDYYQISPPDDPVGPPAGEYRVIRGGSWIGALHLAAFDERDNAEENDVDGDRGFRVVVEIENN
ncbi:MAG: formylglycine-generating enzyme family protein [Planctomycetaceae bacterium]